MTASISRERRREGVASGVDGDDSGSKRRGRRRLWLTEIAWQLVLGWP